MFSKSKIIIFLILLAEFVIVISFGYYVNEKLRELTAKSMGYESFFSPSLGRLIFYNYSINDSMINLRNKVDGYRKPLSQKLRNTEEWKRLEKQDEIDYSIIRISEVFFLTAISVTGLMLWMSHKRRKNKTKWHHLILLILSLFYIRFCLLSLLAVVFGHQPCNDIKLWRLLNVNWIWVDFVILTLGIFILLIILIKLIPKEIRISFIIAGFFGSAISFLIIIKFIGPRLL